MYNVKVTNSIKAHCVNQIKLHNFGKRGTADGTPGQQLTGIIGQSVVADMCGLPLVDGSTGFDGGEDIRIGKYVIDIKTMGRTTYMQPGYVHNFLSLQESYPTDVYIFTSLNKKTEILTVCGWIPKNDLLKNAILYKKGATRKRFDGTEFVLSTDNYELDNKHLRDVFDPDHMMNQIYMGWKPHLGGEPTTNRAKLQV